jgi:hypothetical protein
MIEKINQDFYKEEEMNTENPLDKREILEKTFKEIKDLRETIGSFENKKSEKFLGVCRKLDHQERNLMNDYLALEDIDSARKVVYTMIETPHNQKYKSKEGRLKKLSNL